MSILSTGSPLAIHQVPHPQHSLPEAGLPIGTASNCPPLPQNRHAVDIRLVEPARQARLVISRPNRAVDAINACQRRYLLERMAERLAFQRGSTQLYEALLARLDASPAADAVSRHTLQRYRAEQAEHFEILCEAIEALGGDPSVAATQNVASGPDAGIFVQLVKDPRSSLSQCIEALLTAELADNAAWELLIALCRATAQDDIADRFVDAFEHEQQHLCQVKAWAHEEAIAELRAAI